MVHLSASVIRILRLRSASEISIAGLVGFRFLLDSGLHVADARAVTEAPLAAARDVDDAAPLVTAAREGRLAATWADQDSKTRPAPSGQLEGHSWPSETAAAGPGPAPPGSDMK